MNTPNINFSKVKTMVAEGNHLNVWYNSVAFRQFENVDLSVLTQRAEAAGKHIHILTPGDVNALTSLVNAIQDSGRPTTPSLEEAKAIVASSTYALPSHALINLLGLNILDATHFVGTDRLNFWWTGPTLKVQVARRNRSVKLTCSNTVTPAQLKDFFSVWGWQQLSGKSYFKPVAGSTVKL